MTKPKILLEMEKIPGIETSVQDISASLNDITTLASTINVTNDGVYTLKANSVYDLGGSRITLTKNITFIGNGAMIKNGVLDANGISAKFKDITFDNCCIDIQNDVTDIIFDNCSFANCNDNAIALWHSANLIKIINCKFYNIKPSVAQYKSVDNSGSAIYINTSDVVTKCEIRDNTMSYIYGGTCIFASANFTFIDICKNHIDTILQRGIGFWGANSASRGKVRFNTILNCGVLKASDTNAGVGCNGIYANNSMPYIDVFKNYVKDVYENGIEGNYNSIEGNYIENTGKDTVNYNTPSIEGIYTISTKVIKDNTIINPKGHGIYGYTDSTDFNNMRILNNVIKKDTFDSTNVGICFRSPSCTNVLDITISGNVVENFSGVIELPQNKVYRVKIGVNFARWYDTYLIKGVGNSTTIDVSNNGSVIPVFQNNLFQTWSSTSVLSNWTCVNGVLSQVTADNHNVPHVLANDAYNGRLIQNIFTPTADTNNRFLLISLSMRGTGTSKFIRTYRLDVNGANPTNPVSYYFNIASSTVFKKYYVLIPCNGYAQFEICNTTNGNWFEVSEIQAIYVDWKPEQ
jgi:hypothetical protein